jgi:hypothetical protein
MIQTKGLGMWPLKPRAVRSGSLPARKIKAQLKSRRLLAPWAFAGEVKIFWPGANCTVVAVALLGKIA